MRWIVLFDGGCGLCSRSVRVLARLDRRGVLRFAPLQGETARALGVAPPADNRGSIVVVREDGGARRFLDRADAVVELGEALGGPWRIARVVRLLPATIRDAAYDFIARRRYPWFGRAQSCPLPDQPSPPWLLP